MFKFLLTISVPTIFTGVMAVQEKLLIDEFNNNRWRK
jgi:hypothetical protein